MKSEGTKGTPRPPRPPVRGSGPTAPVMAAPVKVPERHGGGDMPAWLVDTPSIPGPGLAVSLPAAPAGDPIATASIAGVGELARSCQRCSLGKTRTCAVPGEGNEQAGMMVVGEGPGEQEDLSGRPFVGRAGELLDRMLAAIDAPRPTVYIANVVKCRPPGNRVPLPDERSACMPYLHRQISLVRPRVILALGTTAAESLLGIRVRLGEVRGKVHRLDGIPLIVTYHPAALLRNPHWKRPAWDDLRIARQLADIVE